MVHVLPQHLPGRGVVPGPDAAEAVGADVGGAGEQQVPLVQQPVQPLAGGPGHHAAEEVVDLVVALFPAVVQPVEKVLEVRRVPLRLVRVAVVQVGLRALGPVLRGEDGRLVHIVPEALQAPVGVELILVSEPLPDLLPQKVGEVGHAGPHLRPVAGPLMVQAEVPLLHALVVHRIARLDLDPGIHDGHQAEAPLLHPGGIPRQVGEPPLVDGEVDVAVHVVDVHADVVQRDARLPVLVRHTADVPLRLVAPAALAVAEGPEGREEAPSNDSQELPRCVISGFSLHEVQPQVLGLAENGQYAVSLRVDVEYHLGRGIEERAEGFRPVHHEEVVGPIHGGHVVPVDGVVIVEADVPIAPFVDPPHGFAQAVDDVLFPQRAGERLGRALFPGEMPELLVAEDRDVLYHRIGFDRVSVDKLRDHGESSV